MEPLNEVLASEICRRLGINFIPYTFEIRDNQYYSICPDIVDENHEMVSMESVYHDIHLEENQCYNFEKLNRIDKWYEKLLSKLKRIDKEKLNALALIKTDGGRLNKKIIPFLRFIV